jgi:hypothetical protein
MYTSSPLFKTVTVARAKRFRGDEVDAINLKHVQTCSRCAINKPNPPTRESRRHNRRSVESGVTAYAAVPLSLFSVQRYRK